MDLTKQQKNSGFFTRWRNTFLPVEQDAHVQQIENSFPNHHDYLMLLYVAVG